MGGGHGWPKKDDAEAMAPQAPLPPCRCRPCFYMPTDGSRVACVGRDRRPPAPQRGSVAVVPGVHLTTHYPRESSLSSETSDLGAAPSRQRTSNFHISTLTLGGSGTDETDESKTYFRPTLVISRHPHAHRCDAMISTISCCKVFLTRWTTLCIELAVVVGPFP